MRDDRVSDWIEALFRCSAAQGKILADWAASGNPEGHFTSKGIMKITLGGVEYMLLQAFVDDEIPGLALKKVGPLPKLFFPTQVGFHSCM